MARFPAQLSRRGVETAARRRRLLAHGLAVFVMGLFALFFAVPMVWLILAPTKTGGQLVSLMPFAFGSFAEVTRSWDQLYAFGHGEILLWLRNSAVYTVSGTVVAILTGIPAGYGLAVTRFFGRRTLLTVTLIVMLIPANALVLPLFLEMNDVHLINTAFSVILPNSLFPFGVYLSYIFFSSNLPENIVAAARIDGCSEWQAFRHIALPLARPVVSLVVLFNFVASWSNYFLPFVMFYQIRQYPAALGLQLIQGLPAPALALALLLTSAPVVAVFLYAQRAVASGRWGGIR
jgi:multiple sugar transport system permease protein